MADSGDAEGAHRQPDDERGGQEGQRIGDRDEQAAADQGEEGPKAAEDRLTALRAAGDLIVDEVRIEGAVSPPMSRPMTIEESEKSSARTGR
jgi:hypothetical protein